jgi:hypothetical protein
MLGRDARRMLAIACAAFLLGGSEALAEATPRPQLAAIFGSWLRDDARSDDGRAKLDDALRREQPIEHARAGAPRRGRHGESDAGADATTLGEDAVAMTGFVSAGRRLTIASAAGGIVVASEAGVERLYPSGRWLSVEDGSQLRVRIEAGELVREARSGVRTKLETRYRVLLGTGELEVASRLELSSGVSVRARQLYVRAPAGAPAAPSR